MSLPENNGRMQGKVALVSGRLPRNWRGRRAVDYRLRAAA